MFVTSANLSKQAWGEAMNVGGDVRICSYEIGVLVWPELYGEGAVMVPTFKTDTPTKGLKSDNNIVVGARMPYDIPLQSYSKEDLPWCATATYLEPDVCIYPPIRPDSPWSCSIFTNPCYSGKERRGKTTEQLGRF
jgi:tyrosyl-DNA phosphodiesterase-1